LNGIVFINAFLHDPTVGYDSISHLRYIEVLSNMRLPTSADTNMFFCPPLPYIFPALLECFWHASTYAVAKFAQLSQAVLSVVLCWYVCKTCRLIDPDNLWSATAALAMLASMPAYYKSFAFVRGEPFVACFCVIATYFAARVFIKGESKCVVALGVALGLLALSRQSGVMLIPGLIAFVVVLCLKQRHMALLHGKNLASSLLLAVALAAPFYIHLWHGNGTLAAFDKQPYPSVTLHNNPADFYLGFGNGKLFTDPVRNTFDNQLFPILYSDTWGDYWQYFVVYGLDKRDDSFVQGRALWQALRDKDKPDWLITNRFEIGEYLGRVNAFAIVPTLLFVGGIIYALKNFGHFLVKLQISDQMAAASLILFLSASTLAAYAWFLLAYDQGTLGDKVKATYLLQLFPLLAMLSGMFLAQVKRKSSFCFKLCIALLAVAFVHNSPAMITHFVWLPPPEAFLPTGQ
jgi:4-amino-4-deoxy-L-arabinose transferase-like glycosyltransferase